VRFLFLLSACLLAAGCHRSARVALPPGQVVDLSKGWVDITEGMVLLVENAYFRDGATTRTIADYIGTEKLALRAGRGALTVTEHVTLLGRPAKQPPVTALFPEKERARSQHRLYFQVVVDKSSGKANAVVLAAGNKGEMTALAARLTGKTLCTGGCTVFPEGSSVSLAMQIFANGQPRTVLWGTNARAIAGTQAKVTVRRGDKVLPSANGPLLPGDRVEW
jgi:hypothetical protein